MKTKLLPRRATQLLFQTFAKWQQDRCLEMGAALSYYALFSLFPIFLVVTSILGFLLGPETDVFNQILKFARDSLPPESFAIVEETMLQLNQGSVQAGMLGFLLLFLAASSVFGALDRSVDKIWKATEDEVESDSLWSTTISFVGKKLIAFVLVISTAAFLLLSLLSNIVIRIVMQIITKMDRTISIFELNDLLIA
ncbi:MAG: YihY/virulence factor BrkB family protein, partial [Xenococcaceae cyanobacterium]